MKTHHLQLLGLVVVIHYAAAIAEGSYGEELSTCLMVYKVGSAPAVFQSPKCPLWKSQSSSEQLGGSHSPTARCQLAMHQGRRKYQEDRALCVLDVRIPFPGPTGIIEVPVDIVAVFDGHNGAEASEMASKKLLDYLMLHTYFLLDKKSFMFSRESIGRLPNEGEQHRGFPEFKWHVSDIGRLKPTLSANIEGNVHLEILKEALSRAIQDIDAAFSKVSHTSRNNYNSGSMATVILMADGQILVAYIGDSKAFLCFEMFQSPSEAKATFLRLYRQKRSEGAISPISDYGSLKVAASDGWHYFIPKELTRDHHPDIKDERYRVESAGGRVVEWGGIPRVNGQLAVSRSIGDVAFKRYGVVSVPEVTDWQPLTANDRYLVASSDGIFETLSSQDVCDMLWGLDRPAVVIPFRSTDISQTLPKERFDGTRKFDFPGLVERENFIGRGNYTSQL
ncbi:unnamed protein product [Ilex paraguariensis]|uniref:PPM-type phosphatase domain-containing protein n=1 Tax=Ilex paraguariensis TaxID=185542 RepID=A0ABC8UAR2_9AQUA